MKKYILCDAAVANYGKSTTLNQVLSLFREKPDLYKIIPLQEYNSKGDNVCVIRCLHSNSSILIQTGGDNKEAFYPTLDYLKNNQENLPNVIVCASRTKQSTPRVVENICDNYDFHYVEFRNLCAWRPEDIPFIKQLNERFLVPALYETILHLL